VQFAIGGPPSSAKDASRAISAGAESSAVRRSPLPSTTWPSAAPSEPANRNATPNGGTVAGGSGVGEGGKRVAVGSGPLAVPAGLHAASNRAADAQNRNESTLNNALDDLN
jgi:hypothetical protein